MTQFAAAIGSIITRAVPGGAFVGALAAAGALAFAAPAAAAPFFIARANFYSTNEFDSTGKYMSPFVIDAKDGGAGTEDELASILAFCIQYDVPMPYTPVGGVNTLNATFQDGVLSGVDTTKIAKLVNFGTALLDDPGTLSDLELSRELSVIQGAIWTITTGGPIHFYDALYDPGEAEALDLKIVSYLDGTVDLSGVSSNMRVVFAPGYQGLAFAGVAPVPEPAVWAMMIVGFFATGSAMRLARRRALSAL